MNRLIIVGNGFDLAHGLKTSCKDFIIFYLTKIWKNLSNDGSYHNRILNINSSKDYFKENDLKFSEDTAVSIFQKIHKENILNINEPHLTIKSNYFKAIFSKICSLNWADMETEYYNELIHIIEKSHRKRENAQDRVALEHNTTRLIISLNMDLDHLTEILIEYLKIQEEWFLKNKTENSKITEYFNETIYEGELDLPVTTSPKPKHTLYLNFNYTKTLSKYYEGSNIVYIHGTLNDNPIFGFGDDTSEKYKIIEDEYNNEALKKIKSFKYLNNGSYTKLLNFINSDTFQVHIYGHSCGVSDRTLFKQIFESEKCKSIKIFYYNKLDFEEKMYELSRHFNNKNIFLKKVLPFNSLRRMPQPQELQKEKVTTN